MRKQHWFGINVQLCTFLSGVFTIFVTNMYVVFEEKHMGDSNCTSENNQEMINSINDIIVCWSYKIVFSLSMITILISCLLLYSVHAQIYKGMVTYVIWIIFYESVNSLLQALTNRPNDVSPTEVKFLRWFGLISRIFMHGFWIFCVIKYAHLVYKNQMQSNIASYSRRLSINLESKQKRTSKKETGGTPPSCPGVSPASPEECSLPPAGRADRAAPGPGPTEVAVSPAEGGRRGAGPQAELQPAADVRGESGQENLVRKAGERDPASEKHLGLSALPVWELGEGRNRSGGWSSNSLSN
ncbi:transmembrane protein 217 [Dromiciops gliroides]|uniref:transmembrane protein 217 n=1 Tax=Dromiciops gliroides TaxID=33562 RepID=UPI001CC73112|nr:transmembrane protein 217 [Dromiciops gliroides]